MSAQLTTGQRRRITQALAETEQLLAREMRHVPELRRPDQIAFYERHIARLTGYLETDTYPAAFMRS